MRGTIAGLIALAIAFSLADAILVQATAERDSPLILVTFSSLKGDIERVACGSPVYSLIPPGLDPHDYQLRPSDIDLIKHADLIISTGHAYSELKIREIAESGYIRAKLIDALNVSGIMLRTNPVTHQLNIHMPIRDPINYLVFIRKVVLTLAEIDPERAGCYYERFLEVSREVFENLLIYRGNLSGNALVDAPHVQYAVEWLGLKVVWIVKPEESGSVSPESIRRLRELVEEGNVVAAFITWPSSSPESRVLADLALSYNLPIIEVPDPSTDICIYNTLLDVSNKASKLNSTSYPKKNSTAPLEFSNSPVFSIAALSFVAGVLVSLTFTKRTTAR